MGPAAKQTAAAFAQKLAAAPQKQHAYLRNSCNWEILPSRLLPKGHAQVQKATLTAFYMPSACLPFPGAPTAAPCGGRTLSLSTCGAASCGGGIPGAAGGTGGAAACDCAAEAGGLSSKACSCVGVKRPWRGARQGRSPHPLTNCHTVHSSLPYLT